VGSDLLLAVVAVRRARYYAVRPLRCLADILRVYYEEMPLHCLSSAAMLIH
jgi:hypothetical protein